MNFFERQARTRAQSRRMVALFVLSVVAIVVAIDAAVFAGLVMTQQHPGYPATAPELLRDYGGALLVATLLTVGTIVGASLFRIAQLRAGGSVVAEGLGATRIPATGVDPAYRRLRNVIEEIAIASSVPVPAIYVLESEPGINAFAAGFTPADAAITVTRGCLDKLSRDELQGVIAHEFSHIVNGDMRVSIRLMGVIFGILALAVIARGVLRTLGRGRSSSRSGKGGGAIAAVLVTAVLVLVIGYIGVFFARLIKASFSRQRESLADASAVQFTRQTGGLAGALKKIAGLEAGSVFQNAQPEEVSHMLFGEGKAFSSLFATHPPILERIKALEPTFDPRQIEAQAPRWNDPAYHAEDDASPAVSAFAPTSALAAPARLSEQIAAPGAAHYQYGLVARASLPQPLKDLARDPVQARNVVLALLLDPDAALRAKQLALVDARFRGAGKDLESLQAQIAALDPSLRLPLATIAFPALRQCPREELLGLVNAVSELARADGDVSLFEYCLGRMVRTHIADALNPAKAAIVGRSRIPDCEAEAVQLLAAIAQAGNEDEAAARRAFSAGLAPLLPQSKAGYAPGAAAAAVLDPALMKLNGLSGPAKELLIESLLKTITHDGRITVGEAELLRAICAALHCPLPPLVATADAA